jgi:hypothetical protein
MGPEDLKAETESQACSLCALADTVKGGRLYGDDSDEFYFKIWAIVKEDLKRAVVRGLTMTL